MNKEYFQLKLQEIENGFYKYKNRFEMLYLFIVIIYSIAVIFVMMFFKKNYLEIYSRMIIRVVFFILIILGLATHYLIKYIFNHKYKYEKYFVKAFEEYNKTPEEKELIFFKEIVTEIYSSLTKNELQKNVFIKNVALYLKVI